MNTSLQTCRGIYSIKASYIFLILTLEKKGGNDWPELIILDSGLN